ncbi:MULTISPECIES: hypothetical protein [Bradyrhizobium]|uniref:hypothetical protein n=1 Tax=Bradyrhizobium TaxID=374 RepID=UPI0009754404|nr:MULTISPECIES: hypothetical protein [Bradyrhizobium]
MSIGAKNLGAEHLNMAGEHLELAAKQYRDAAKCYDAGNGEKAAHHALVARGELILAQDHEKEASKYHASEHG